MADINVTVESPPNYPVTVSSASNTVVTVTPPPALTVVLDNGRQGPAGVGVPAGGTIGQILAKLSNTSYDTGWINNQNTSELTSGTAAPTGVPATIPAIYIQQVQPHPVVWAYYNATAGWEVIASGSTGVDQFRNLLDVIFTSTTTNTYSSDTVGTQQIVAFRQTSATTWVIDYSGAQIGALQVGNLISATNTGTPTLYTISNLFWSNNFGAITVNQDPSLSWSLGSFSVYKVTQTIAGPADKSAWWYRTASNKLEAFSIDAEIQNTTTNTLVSNGNVLTSTVNGKVATANTIKTNAIVKGTNTIQTVVNDIGSAATTLVDSVALTNSTNTITSTVNGVAATAPAVNTVVLGNGTAASTLRATVNGVASNDFTLPNTGVTIAQVDAEIAAKVGAVGANLPLTTTTITTTHTPFNRFSDTVTSVDIAVSSQAAGDAFLMSIGSVLTGTNWSTPTTNTYLGISATPGTAVAKLLNAAQSGSILQLYLERNTALEALRLGPYTLFSGSEKFTFVPPPQTEIIRLINANAPAGLNNGIPLDVVSWTNDYGVSYVSNTTVATQVATITAPANPYISGAVWNFAVNQSFPAGFNNAVPNRVTEVIGTDALGRTVSGVFTSQAISGNNASIQQTNADRIAGGGFVGNQQYTMTWRLGKLASAAIFTDGGTVGNNQNLIVLSPGTGINMALDPNNDGRYVISSSNSGVTSVNSLTGAVLVASPDNSIIVGNAGQTIELQTAQTGGAGVATGYNVGNYVASNVLVYSGNQAPPSTAVNEGQVQIGTGTGYSTNTSVIAPAPQAAPTQGWTFGGQKANNVVVELGAQKQIFRLGVSGTWSSIPVYGDSAVIKKPVFLKYNTDFDSGSPFPGLITASGSAAPLEERSTVNATARYCKNLGYTCVTQNFNVGGVTVNGIGLVSSSIVSGSSTSVVIFTVTSAITATNIGNGDMTLPLEVYSGGQWIYLGAEWSLSNDLTQTPTQVQLTLPDAGVYNNNPVRILNGATTPLFAWFNGLPPVDTVFGASLASAAGYVEVHVPANIWVADTATYKPQGFTLPTSASAPQGYNFDWTIVSGTQALNTLQYWHYNLADQYDPSDSNIPNWNNRITINYGSSGSAIPGNLWDTWVLNWTARPQVLTGTYTDPNSNSGRVIRYSYGGVTRYRFVPTTYAPNNDAFYSTLSGTTVSGLLTARSS